MNYATTDKVSEILRVLRKTSPVWWMQSLKSTTYTVTTIKTVLLVLISSICVLSAAYGSNHSAAGRIGTESGFVSGEAEDGVLVYRGIPYAAPPVGGLRWAPPQPALPWEGVLQASHFGPACIQPKSPARELNLPGESEDCLTLNIWQPKDSEQLLPVMVWIHGGAFRLGSGALPWYDGAALARQGVMLVTFNYRLGRLGFFAHPALTAERSGEAVGNYGIMDQIALLKWIQRNIKAFGGDPKNVTIFGESAGAVSVNYLMTIAAANGLFHKAIAQSGGGYQIPRHIRKLSQGHISMEEEGQKYAKKWGLGGGNITTQALRSVAADDIAGDNAPVESLGFGPFIDGQLIVDGFPKLFSSGQQHDVPYIVGANSFDGSVMMFRIRKHPRLVLKAMLKGDYRVARDLYQADGKLDINTFAAQLTSDAFFIGGARHQARGMEQVSSPAWLYHFSFVTPAKRGKIAGAAHGSEIPYVWMNLKKAEIRIRKYFSEEDFSMSRAMSGYWTRFAKTGDPNGASSLVWPPYETDSDILLDFGNNGAVLRKGYRSEKLNFHDERYNKRLSAEDEYGDIHGEELYGYLKDIAAISRRSQADGDVLWGRISGSKYDAMTADYMKRYFEAFGLDKVWQEEFETTAPQLVASEVRLTLIGGSSPASPQADYDFETAMPTWPMILTPRGGIEAPIVEVGGLSQEELAKIDLNGKIALVHSTVWGLREHLAKGAVLPVLKDGRAVAVVCAIHPGIQGNMQVAIPNFRFTERSPQVKALPQINLGSGDGHFLAQIIADAPAGNPPHVRIVIQGEALDPRPTRNTFGLIRGNTDEWIIFTAHTDGWFEAANDNGSGLATMLGLAKFFAAQPPESIRRNLLFVATAGHHDGPAIGTWNMVKNHLDILEHTALIINLEHLASVGPIRGTEPDLQYAETPHVLYDTHSHPIIRRLLIDSSKRFGVPVNENYVSDQYQADLFPFSSVGPTGVPSLMLLQPSYWYHTSADTIDKISPRDLGQVARLYAHMIDVLNEMSLTEMRQGWKGHKASRLPPSLNPLGMDLGLLRDVNLVGQTHKATE